MSVGVMKDYKLKLESYDPRIHWVGRGTGTPKDRDEVYNRSVSECDGWVCDWEVIVAQSRLRLIRKTVTLGRISPYFDFNIEENTARRKWKYDDPKFDYADWTPGLKVNFFLMKLKLI
jgi:hypothetical protein